MNFRLAWLILVVAFGALSFVTDFSGEALRRPAPSVQTPVVELQQQHQEPVRQWVFEEDNSRKSSVGTAFKVGERTWLTARHVVDGCDSLWFVGKNGKINDRMRVNNVIHHKTADASLIYHALESESIEIARQTGLPEPDAPGYHFGFPGGEPGDVRSMYLGTSRALQRDLGNDWFPILVWAAVERPSGLDSFGGLSGGPVVNDQGEIVGITIGESFRRGRVSTTAPVITFETINAADAISFVDETDAKRVEDLGAETYKATGDRLRRQQSVVQLYCHVIDPASPSSFDSP